MNRAKTRRMARPLREVVEAAAAAAAAAANARLMAPLPRKKKAAANAEKPFVNLTEPRPRPPAVPPPNVWDRGPRGRMHQLWLNKHPTRIVYPAHKDTQANDEPTLWWAKPKNTHRESILSAKPFHRPAGQPAASKSATSKPAVSKPRATLHHPAGVFSYSFEKDSDPNVTGYNKHSQPTKSSLKRASPQ